MKPLLLLDVDGVLNPIGRPAPGYRQFRCLIDDETYVVHLDPRHGPRLLGLAAATGAELVWATTWEHHANDWIAPRIGLPSLPVIGVNAAAGPVSEHGEMFKTPHVAAYAGRRPFVWFDDQVWAEDEEYLRVHQGLGDFLLVHVDPARGLTSRHLGMAHEWLTLTGFSQGS
ncbi:HAD domain-containing protein [Actinomadura sp. ATCC 31491]|uniref:HAD domain-containing protein n=1 Tax=Actinomadura luzonensis TaxID=2805427 RepID=A0ABT0FRB7_9ACTN|nr:HAD domain-containing protein [Actinomadura luzonensis]MCK2214852.1 HAD domain-containing protein [Actinomadura luzonensis]